MQNITEGTNQGTFQDQSTQLLALGNTEGILPNYYNWTLEALGKIAQFEHIQNVGNL